MVSEEREENVIPAICCHLHYDCTCMCIVCVYCVCVCTCTYTYMYSWCSTCVTHTHIHCQSRNLVVTSSNLLTLVASYHLLAVVHHVCVMDYSAYMYMYCTCTVVILQYIQCTYYCLSISRSLSLAASSAVSPCQSPPLWASFGSTVHRTEWCRGHPP